MSTEQVGQLPEEVSSKSATPEELGVTKNPDNPQGLSIDFAGLLDKAAAKAGVDLEEVSKPGDGLADKHKQEVQPEEKEETDETEKPEETDETEKPDDKGEDEELNEAGVPEKEPKVKAKKAKAEPEKPSDEAKKEEPAKQEPPKSNERDADLTKQEQAVDPHVRPPTRKVINSFKAAAVKARDEKDAVAKELEAARKEAAALKEQIAKSALPKEVEEELKTLRDQVRTLDASRDPAIVSKYDNKIKANTDSVVKALEDLGLPKEATADLRKKGITLANLKQYIDVLETGKGLDGKQYDADPDTAEAIREALRENIRLSKQKESEIAEWKANYETRTKAQQEEQAKEQARQIEELTKRRDKELMEEVGKFDFLSKPPEVLDTDSPAIKKEKEKIIAEHNERINRFAEASKKEMASDAERVISATKGIFYRTAVVPYLQNKIAALEKQLAEKEGRVEKMKSAGAVSKTVSPTPKPPKESEEDDFESSGDAFEDAIERAARKVGVK